MAAVNPIEDILNSEIDQSEINQIVGSLESQINSPTPKFTDVPNINNTSSQNNGVKVQSQNVNIGNRLNTQPVLSLADNVHKLSNGNVLQTRPQLSSAVPVLSNVVRPQIHTTRTLQTTPNVVTIGSTNTGTIARPSSNITYRPHNNQQQIQIVNNANTSTSQNNANINSKANLQKQVVVNILKQQQQQQQNNSQSPQLASRSNSNTSQVNKPQMRVINPAISASTGSGGVGGQMQQNIRPLMARVGPANQRMMSLSSNQTLRLANPQANGNFPIAPGALLVKNGQGQLVMVSQQVLNNANATQGSVRAPTATPAVTTPTVTTPIRPINQTQENIRKCKNFLTTLIKLASSQPQDTVDNVRTLVQSLIDGAVEPMQFTSKLQVELKSSPQPYLIPFLKKSLPPLRNAMITDGLQIDGIKPPNPITLKNKTIHKLNRQNLTKQQVQVIMNQQQQQRTNLTNIQNKPNVRTIQPNRPEGSTEKKRFDQNRDDDDINDVATMGGVNLNEESAAILATNSELISGNMRSCGHDRLFLNTHVLQRRIQSICNKHNLRSTSHIQVTHLVSHAVQEKLRTFAEKLSVLSSHRLEPMKFLPNQELSIEVRPQLKLLEEVDHVEQKKREENERELLLRAARSRSKQDDPEQLKLKEKAKALQQQEMDEIRHREANLTAMAAIGPRKKARLETPDTSEVTKTVLRERVKRATMKDLQFIMDNERHYRKGNMLYMSHMKQ